VLTLEVLKVFGPVVCLAGNVLLQVLSFRINPKMSLLRSVYFGFAYGSLFLSCFALYAYFRFRMDTQDYLGLLFSGLLTYGCLAYCYFHFINLGETARRIRILREIHDSKDGLTYEEILQRYNAKMILEIRVKRLIDSGQIELRGGAYFIRTPVVLLFSRMILRMKKLLYGKNYLNFI
jgi:hypothetical protein